MGGHAAGAYPELARDLAHCGGHAAGIKGADVSGVGAQLSTIYNDAFNEMLGKRQVLGCSFDDVLGESWEKVGPILFKALSGEATLIENLPLIINRNGASEPSYFTFSCTPVRDESGAIVGVLDKVIETTAHVQSEQQWRMLAFAHEQQVRARTADLEHLWQLSGGMAQDVKNLLGGICSSLALLEQRLAQGHLERLDTCIESARGRQTRPLHWQIGYLPFLVSRRLTLNLSMSLN